MEILEHIEINLVQMEVGGRKVMEGFQVTSKLKMTGNKGLRQVEEDRLRVKARKTQELHTDQRCLVGQWSCQELGSVHL